MKKVLLIIYSLAIIFTFGAVVIYLAPNILTKESDSNEQDNNETVDFIEEETKDFDFNLEDLGENSYRLTVQIPNEFLGLDLVLAFDPTKIQVDEVIEGNMLKKHIHELDNEKGYVILSGAGREEGLDASEYFYDLK
ncbi:hypothetical protein KC678_00410, partial [Candidatus Dojkabacteria bacterium]|nr:hypothetical protein [Candidatus Dojkabacteria bacterium]